MNRNLWILAIVLPALITGTAFQARPKPKPKPPQKKQTTATTKSTVQMPGDKGIVGTTYQIGNVNDEFHFTLDSAEVALRYKAVEDTILATGPDRLLILTFSVQNPNKNDMSFSYSSFKFTSVSPDDENRDCNSYAYHPDRRTRLSMMLKPAQKIKAVVAFPVHGTGPITKLIVARGSNRPVIRYDLRAKTKPMTSIFSADGISVEPTVKAPFAKPFDFGAFDLTVEKVEAPNEPVGQYSASGDQQIFTVTISFTNMIPMAHRLSWGTFQPQLKDENGEAIDWVSDMLTMASHKTIDVQVEGDETVKAQIVFKGVKGQVPKKLKLFNNELQRTVNIDLP